jgi:chloride channel 7
MDGNDHKDRSPPAQPERDGSFNYDIESTDGGGAWRGSAADALLRYDDDGPRQPLLRKRTTNTTSQIAIIGANICSIESLDYEYVSPPTRSTRFC